MSQFTYSVIVAEDEELLLTNLVQKIQNTQLGFEVLGTAQTGKKALELVKMHSPDLVITDIKMPIMDGIELLDAIHLTFPTIRFIIISGFSDFDYAKQAIRLKVNDYLLKPIDSEELYTSLLKIKTDLDLERSSYETFFSLSSLNTSKEHIAEMLKEYIVHHYTSEINLNLIASSMNYSSSYLTKLFVQHYNCTPSKYIITLRLQKARHLLLHHPELSIRQIGELVGYQDQGYFSRIFKKQQGVSPFDYREQSVNA
ncbi:DNA-binding response regulator [Sporanaerobium hydrogeniformans]|uniref:DNA-binding response regulator n=1 Tax=Sporanaerobium hydrogeniformans TaxID=3072179 RepID=A0AC61D8I6_9FIRM|nr:response regulator [Sporanaerobium hydrogeniformans]PHV69584.1 DNA-binding response regulator [Sporanaerobium hydrogeniformans]